MKTHKISGFDNINTYYDTAQVANQVGVEGENIDTTKRTLSVRRGLEPSNNGYDSGTVEVYRHPQVVDCGAFLCWVDNGQLYTQLEEDRYGTTIKRWAKHEYSFASGEENSTKEHYLAYPWEEKTYMAGGGDFPTDGSLIKVKTNGGYEAIFTTRNVGLYKKRNAPLPWFYNHCRFYYDRFEKKVKAERIPLYIPTVASYGKPMENKNLLTNTFKVNGLGYRGAYESLKNVVGYDDNLRYRYIRATVNIEGKEYRIPSLMFEFFKNNSVGASFPNVFTEVHEIEKSFNEWKTEFEKSWNRPVEDSVYNWATSKQAIQILNKINKKKEFTTALLNVSEDWYDKSSPHGTIKEYERFSHEEDMIGLFVSPKNKMGIDMNIRIKLKNHSPTDSERYLRYFLRLGMMELLDWTIFEEETPSETFETHLDKIKNKDGSWRDNTKKGNIPLGHIKKCAKFWAKKRSEKEYSYDVCGFFDAYVVTLEVVEDRRGLMRQKKLGSHGGIINEDVDEISGTTKKERIELKKQYAEYKDGDEAVFKLTPNALGTTSILKKNECFVCNDISKGLYAQDGNQTENQFQKHQRNYIFEYDENKYGFLNNAEVICGDTSVFVRTYTPRESDTPFAWYIQDEKIMDGDYYPCIAPFAGGFLIFARRQGIIYLHKQLGKWEWLIVSGKIKKQMDADTEWLKESNKYGDFIYTGFSTINGKRVFYKSTMWRSCVYEIRKRRQELDSYEEKERIAFGFLCSRQKLKFDSFNDKGYFGHKECKQNDDAVDRGYGGVFVKKEKDDRVAGNGYKQIYLEEGVVKCQYENGATQTLPETIMTQSQEKKTRIKKQQIKKGDIINGIVQLEDKEIDVKETYYEITNNHYNLIMEHEWEGVRQELEDKGHKYFFDKYGVEFKREFLKTLKPADAWNIRKRVDEEIREKGGTEETDMYDFRYNEEKTYYWRNYDYIAPYLKQIKARPAGGSFGAKAIELTEREKKDSNAVRRIELLHNVGYGNPQYINTIQLNEEKFVGYYEIPVVARWKSKVLDLGYPTAKKTLHKMILHIKDGKGSIRFKLWRDRQVVKDYVIYNSERTATEGFDHKAISVPLRQQNIVEFQYEIFLTGKVEIVSIETLYDITRLI